MPKLRSTKIQQTPSGWLRSKDVPLSRTFINTLREQGLLEAVIAMKPGGRRGVLLISQKSLDAYLSSLSPKGPDNRRFKPGEAARGDKFRNVASSDA